MYSAVGPYQQQLISLYSSFLSVFPASFAAVSSRSTLVHECPKAMSVSHRQKRKMQLS